MARTQEEIDRDNGTDNDLVDHLIANCPELSGYTRVAKWEDTLKKRRSPDRLLENCGTAQPLVGVETTKLLPFEGRNGSPLMSVDTLWHQTYVQACTLFPNGWNITVVFRGMKLDTIATSGPLAGEIVDLLVQEKPAMPRFDIVEKTSSELTSRFPLLASAVDRVQMILDDQPKWVVPYCEGLGCEWICEAIENRIREKQALIHRYQQEIGRDYPSANPKMHLLLWCPESTIISEVIEMPQSMLGRVESAMAASDFDRIWYVNGIRNGESGKLSCLQKLYPLPEPDRRDDVLKMGFDELSAYVLERASKTRLG